MILLTVGSQLRFDRLVRAVDDWCAASGRRDVFGQIGEPGPQGYRPSNFEWETFVDPEQYDALLNRADLLVAHAGMGSIISALSRAKPIVVMPRRAALGETRNDHQLSTVVRFADRRGVYVASDEGQLVPVLERALGERDSMQAPALSAYAEPALTDSIRRFILGAA